MPFFDFFFLLLPARITVRPGMRNAVTRYSFYRSALNTMACFAEDDPGTTMTPMDKKEPGNIGFFMSNGISTQRGEQFYLIAVKNDLLIVLQLLKQPGYHYP